MVFNSPCYLETCLLQPSFNTSLQKSVSASIGGFHYLALQSRKGSTIVPVRIHLVSLLEQVWQNNVSISACCTSQLPLGYIALWQNSAVAKQRRCHLADYFLNTLRPVSVGTLRASLSLEQCPMLKSSLPLTLVLRSTWRWLVQPELRMCSDV